MEFKSLRNIESSFKQIRIFGAIFLVACAIVAGYSVWKSYDFAERQREKIYVLDDGKSLMFGIPIFVRTHRKEKNLTFEQWE